MKLTTTQWTNVQSVLEETKPEESRILVAHIEARTWGKRWSQEVAIGLRKADERLVNEALEQLKSEGSET